MYESAVDFKNQHSHLRTDDEKLQQWLKRQIDLHHAEKLSQGRIELLENIGFRFAYKYIDPNYLKDLSTENLQMIGELDKFAQKHGSYKKLSKLKELVSIKLFFLCVYYLFN